MPATTRAKFKCQSITLNDQSILNPELKGVEYAQKVAKERGIPYFIQFAQPTVKLVPVYAPDDDGSENHKFWEASPNGELTMAINNPAGAETFEIGREYYLDFTPVPEEIDGSEAG